MYTKKKKSRPSPKKRKKLFQQRKKEQENTNPIPDHPDILVRSERFRPPSSQYQNTFVDINTVPSSQQYNTHHQIDTQIRPRQFSNNHDYSPNFNQHSNNYNRNHSNYMRNYSSYDSRNNNQSRYDNSRSRVYIEPKQNYVPQSSYKSKTSKQNITARSKLRNKRKYKVYELDVAYSLQDTVQAPLPEETLNIFFANCTIRREMNTRDVQAYVTEMSQYDSETLQKKVNALCNKVGDKTYVKISQKLTELLKIDASLAPYIISSIIQGVQRLVVSVNSNNSNRYEQLKCYANVCKATQGIDGEILHAAVVKAFKENISKLNIASDNKVLEDYVRNKSAYINFFVFILTLRELGHFDIKTVKYLINHVYTRILTASVADNDTLIPALCTAQLQCNHKLVSLHQIRNIMQNAAFSLKSKFELKNLLEQLEPKKK